MKKHIASIIIHIRLGFLLCLYRNLRTSYWHVIWRLGREIKKSARYNIETTEVMRRLLKSDSNCIDVGCNEGVVMKEILKFSPDGKHYAFEPIPELSRLLISRFPHVKIFQIALSNVKEQTNFYDVETRRSYSGLKGRNLGKTEQVREITVQTDLLDNLIPDDLPIHFIKIDVEGAELLVLKGAINTIRKNKPTIIFEHGLGGADFYNTSPIDIYELLVTECGLQISLMKDWLEGKSPMNREKFIDQFNQNNNYYFIACK